MSPRSRVYSLPLAIETERYVSRRAFLQGSAAALAVLALPALPTRAAGKGALVRYVNVAAEAPALDIYVDGERVVVGLAFGKATKPARQPGGTLEFVVVPTGEDLGQSVLTSTLTLDENLRFVIPIYGEFPDLHSHPFAVLVRPLEPDTARLRLVDLVTDLGGVDLGISDGPTIYEDVRYPGATKYADIDAGAVDLEIRATGTSDVLLSRSATELEAGRVYDLIVYGREADGSLDSLLLSATAEDADDEQSSAAPDAAEKAYLTDLKDSASLLRLSFLRLDQMLQILAANPNAPIDELGWVFIGWVVVHQNVEAATAPQRFEELKSAYLAVLEPLATTARQMANVDDYLSGAADTVSLTGLNVDVMLQTVVNILPLHEAAEAQLNAALMEAGLPLESEATSARRSRDDAHAHVWSG